MGRIPGLMVLHRTFCLSTWSCHWHRRGGGWQCYRTFCHQEGREWGCSYNLQLNQLYQDGHPCPVTWREVNFANEAFSHPAQSKCTSKLNLNNKLCDFVWSKNVLWFETFSIWVNYLRRMVFYVFKYMQYSDLIHNVHVINVNNILKWYYALFNIM